MSPYSAARVYPVFSVLGIAAGVLTAVLALETPGIVTVGAGALLTAVIATGLALFFRSECEQARPFRVFATLTVVFTSYPAGVVVYFWSLAVWQELGKSRSGSSRVYSWLANEDAQFLLSLCCASLFAAALLAASVGILFRRLKYAGGRYFFVAAVAASGVTLAGTHVLRFMVPEAPTYFPDPRLTFVLYPVMMGSFAWAYARSLLQSGPGKPCP